MLMVKYLGNYASRLHGKGGKVYGFLIGFHKVNFVLSSHAAAKRKQKFCVKSWFRNSQGLLGN